MIALIGAIVGLFSSALPDLFGIFKKRQEFQHELSLMNLQMQAAAAGHQFNMEAMSAKADIAEVDALHKEFAERKETYLWIEALISSVRPVLTYAFFALYAAVKGAQFSLALRATGDLPIAVAAIWHDADMALFATIIAFWFGHRAMRHFRRDNERS